MVPRGLLAGAACALALSRGVTPASAREACGPRITRATVVPCALAASFAVRAARHGVDAARGRESAAAVLLPSNPQVAFSVSARSADPAQRAVNWSATLSQEIAIAGQRGARLDVARAEMDAEERRVVRRERDAAKEAWIAYFDAIAAREQLTLSERLAALAERLAASVRSRAESGVAAPIEADLAYAASVRMIGARAAAERRLSVARATLALAVGAEPSAALEVQGDLTPLPVPDASPAALVKSALAARVEIDVAKAQVRASERRASLLRRSRVPNVTLSVGLANDGFHERVVTGGIAFPIPLPSPLGRTHAGEIAEAVALARRAEADAGKLERQIRLEVAVARAAFVSRRRALDAFDAARVDHVEKGLASLADELAAGRLSVRDALVAQQGLVELLLSHVEAKHALCVASVELARAAGVALERGAR
jgi:outer membrane protein, heavy metal efflux system